MKANLTDVPKFNNGRALRSYQLESLQWMMSCLNKKQNALLADEVCVLCMCEFCDDLG